jgi:hypothetical protein
MRSLKMENACLLDSFVYREIDKNKPESALSQLTKLIVDPYRFFNFFIVHNIIV